MELQGSFIIATVFDSGVIYTGDWGELENKSFDKFTSFIGEGLIMH